MTKEQKENIKKAGVTFIKAIVPPAIAFATAVLTTLISGDDVTGTVVGSVAGTVCNGLVYA